MPEQRKCFPVKTKVRRLSQDVVEFTSVTRILMRDGTDPDDEGPVEDEAAESKEPTHDEAESPSTDGMPPSEDPSVSSVREIFQHMNLNDDSWNTANTHTIGMVGTQGTQSHTHIHGWDGWVFDANQYHVNNNCANAQSWNNWHNGPSWNNWHNGPYWNDWHNGWNASQNHANNNWQHWHNDNPWAHTGWVNSESQA